LLFAIKKAPRRGAFGFYLALRLFRKKSGKIVVIRKRKSVGFFAHYLIKFCESCFVIRLYEKSADAAAKGSKEVPAEERKLKNEYLPFFAAGHKFGKFEGFFGAYVGLNPG